ncbi:hypothetical protein Btru_070310 [Bulinus truncatus]|nr:hypothetical protein Btru_070310 [Bulinus truncatus]
MDEDVTWTKQNIIKKLTALEKRVDELTVKNKSKESIEKAVIEEVLKQVAINVQEKCMNYMEAQIIKVKEQLKDIVCDQNQLQNDLKEIKCMQAELHYNSFKSLDHNLKHALQSKKEQSTDKSKPVVFCNERLQSQNDLSETKNSDLKNDEKELENLIPQVREIALNLQKITDDLHKQDLCCKTSLTEFSSRLKKLEQASVKSSNTWKKKFKTLCQNSEESIQESFINLKEEVTIFWETHIMALQQDINNCSDDIENYKAEINSEEANEKCLQLHENAVAQIEKLNFVFESLSYQCTDLSEKLTELQNDFLRLKNFQDILSMQDTETFSKKEVFAIVTDMGLRYEMIKALITQRVKELENSKRQLALFDRSVQQRKVLDEKLTQLTAFVENLQLYVLTQDKSDFDRCLKNFETNWPSSPPSFDLTDWDVQHSVSTED